MRNKIYLILLTVFLLSLGIVMPGTTAENGQILITWDAPTTMGDVCTSTTPIEGLWSYTVEYRIFGATTWIPVEVATNSYLLTGLLYKTKYEVRVGAHRAGAAVVCPSAIVSATTKDAPSPGGCSNLKVTPQ